jgi:NADH-quinone oxidoreductase subunit A
MSPYFPILLMIAFAFAFGGIMMLASRVLSTIKPTKEKSLPYECGFDAREDARSTFNIRYYLVAILFLLFDLELIFLVPWAVVFADISSAAFWSMMLFLAILVVGFVYEWKRGALEWD